MWFSIFLTSQSRPLPQNELSASAPTLVQMLPTAAPAPTENVCGSCAHVNAADDKFCLSCGSKLAPLPAAVLVVPTSSIPTETKCKVCGTWNEPGCKFCADCGDNLAAQQQPREQQPTASVSSASPSQQSTPQQPLTPTSAPPAQTVTPLPPDRETMIKCPKCRRPNPSDKKFCRKCGESMDAPPAPSKRGSGAKQRDATATTGDSGSSDTGEATAKREATIDCRQCGKGNPMGCVFCKKCGTRLPAQKRTPADEVAALRRANSSFQLQPKSADKPKERNVRCPDPACAKPNRPGDAKCRVCGTALPLVKGASSAGPKQAPRLADLKRPENLKKSDSSAFLNKGKDKSLFEDEVGAWLKRRDAGGGGVSDAPTTASGVPKSVGEKSVVVVLLYWPL